MVGRVGERRDDLQQLVEGAGPTVSDDQWHRVGTFASLVDEVDVETVDISMKVGEGVDGPLHETMARCSSM